MKRDTSFTWRRTDSGQLRLDKMNVAIVGGTGGIGRAIARLMAARGARVTVVGQTFRDSGTPGIEFLKADLSLMSEAQRIAAALSAEKLDLVLFTTGIFAAPGRQETAEGIERDLAVSYLNRLVIVREIAARLGTQRPQGEPKPRVFVMGYPGAGQTGTLDDLNAEKSYRAMTAHMNTVAGNEMLVLDGARRYPDVGFYGLNPGLIKTNIRGNLFGQGSARHRLAEALIGLMTPSADTYARRITPLLVSPDLEGRTGLMFDRRGHAILASPKLTDGHIDAFMTASKALIPE
jgi:NAD(P)-dependent dehydrogenase (short-subunit alcohol dehydrogenase family)